MDLDDHVHGNGVVLCARCSGRWDIFTSSGTVYRVDLDRSIVVRTPPSKQFLTPGLHRGGAAQGPGTTANDQDGTGEDRRTGGPAPGERV